MLEVLTRHSITSQPAGALADANLNSRACFVAKNRLHQIGCMWGCILVMLWRAMAGFEGVLVTRRFGYGGFWLPMSALGLALTWQARICFHHSCESDLFQVKGHLLESRVSVYVP